MMRTMPNPEQNKMGNQPLENAGIQIVVAKVVSLDVKARTVTLESGEAIVYEKLGRLGENFPEERRCAMAVNFRIVVHENSENLHLALNGDFDVSSAYELLGVLERRCHFVSRAFIHTNGLRRVHPTGVSTFKNNLGALRDDPCMDLEFTGDHAKELAPEKSKLH